MPQKLSDRQILVGLARKGVIDRLTEMQAELNHMHRLFPEIVANPDGTTPSVLPMVRKVDDSVVPKSARHVMSGKLGGRPKGSTKRGKVVGGKKLSKAERSARARRMNAIRWGKAKPASAEKSAHIQSLPRRKGKNMPIADAVARFTELMTASGVPMTLNELAKETNLTPSRVQQIVYDKRVKGMFKQTGEKQGMSYLWVPTAKALSATNGAGAEA